MRRVQSIAAILFCLTTCVVAPQKASALQCGWAIAELFYPEESKPSKEVLAEMEKRAAIENLTRMTTIIRGRVVAARSLTDDDRKTNTPIREIILEDVTTLRGRALRSKPKRVIVIEKSWCDADCGLAAERNWPPGKIVTLAPDIFDKPGPTRFGPTQELIYPGRVHYKLHECSATHVSAFHLDVLKLPPDEVERLKRLYPPLQ